MVEIGETALGTKGQGKGAAGEKGGRGNVIQS